MPDECWSPQIVLAILRDFSLSLDLHNQNLALRNAAHRQQKMPAAVSAAGIARKWEGSVVSGPSNPPVRAGLPLRVPDKGGCTIQ
jgi:hypothetical protein